MSQVRVNNITNRTGITGPSVAGIANINSSSHFVVPSGRTGQRYADEGENIVRDGLVLYLDAKYSYPGTNGIGMTTTNPDVYTWYDMSDSNCNFELKNFPTYSINNGGNIGFTTTGTTSTTRQLGFGSKPIIGSSLNSPFTLESVCKVTSTSAIGDNSSGWRTVLAISGARRQIGFSGTSTIYFRIGGNAGAGNIFSPATVTVSPNTWVHILMTFNGNTASGYLNGSLVFDSIDIGKNGSEHKRPIIATFEYDEVYTNGQEILDGNIAIARIYNKALTAAEVLQNYNVYKSRFGLS